MKENVVLFTTPGSGHLIPMVALAKLFVHQGFTATVVTFNHPFRPGKTDEDVSRLSSADSLMAFHVLPPVTIDDSYSNAEPHVAMFAALKAQKENLRYFIINMCKTSSLRAIMVDSFCMVVVGIAKELTIPAYYFTPFGASTTAFFLNLLELDRSSKHSLKDLGESPTNFPGLPPVPASDFPVFLLDRKSESYKAFVETLPSFLESDGILINTFESLEPKAMSALREGMCVPGFKMPPIYSIGPLITESREEDAEERHECLKWLDSQPKGTVVFLCFGSLGCFTPDQIKEIAIGLENSGQRFLWVVKVTDDPSKNFSYSVTEFAKDQVLPEGFVDRTKDRGLVVRTWVPQIQVLHHESIGGFVTHCGWNSVLEAVTTGKPMIFWPLYAEQRVNKAVLLDEELRLGVAIEGYDGEMVGAEEVEAKVRWLMETEGGRMLKERTKEMKAKAMELLSEPGSSSKPFMQFLTDLEMQKLVETKI